MFSKVVPFLVGAIYILYQVLAQDTYTAELMIESNVTLEAETIVSILDTMTDMTVTDGSDPHTVSISESLLIAECLLVGDDTSCNCTLGFTWSNEVCYNESCCRDDTCNKNVSNIAPLCVPKIQVMFNGSAETASSWTPTETALLTAEFEKLNALESFNVSIKSDKMVEFVGAASVAPTNTFLQTLLATLQSTLPAEVLLDTLGMVSVMAPEEVVCYLSQPLLTCTFEEESERARWTLTKPTEHLDLSQGTVVKLESCADHPSCSKLMLDKVTSIWSGTYTCGFVKGLVTYKGQTVLNVALLPDEVKLALNPIAAECSSDPTVDVEVTATVPQSKYEYEVWWSFNGKRQENLQNTTEGEQLVYVFTVPVPCEKTSDTQLVNITFRNLKGQEKSAQVEIPVLYAGEQFCAAETLDGEFWPKTPYKATVFNRTCPEGRTGYKSRTCEGPSWQDPYYYCVNEKLNNVLGAAEDFLKGRGATEEVALDIFSDLKNSSTAFHTDTSSNTADVDVSINILNTMAKASEKIVLREEVLPNFVGAASNMLNTTWAGVNQTNLHNMSADYLEAVETLMENIQTNKSQSIRTDNIDLKVCPDRDCNATVFDIQVSLNRTTGRPKIVAVKNLTPKLENNYPDTERTGFLLSATLSQKGRKTSRSGDDDGGGEQLVEILLDFPTRNHSDSKPLCVFWNVTTREWSDEGCFFSMRDDNGTVCRCDHLTSFSVLMSKGDVSTKELDIITNVGLAVSVCSLIVFLAIEFLVWSAVVKSNLSHFRHTAMVNIATFRLLADCSFLASIEPKVLSDTMCFALTVCKHLFYVAMFCWMLCLSIMLVHQLIFVFSPLRKRVFMLLSSFVGYAVPILIVGISFVFYKSDGQRYYDPKTCWLTFEKLMVGSMHAFLIPIGSVIFVNIFSMAVVIVTLVKTQTPDSGKADDKETAKSIIKVLLVLTPVFGTTWIIGFFLLILDNTDPAHSFISYTFTILNSFQGLFILFAGCIAEQKVREELVKRIKGKGNSDSSKTLTSTAVTKDK